MGWGAADGSPSDGWPAATHGVGTGSIPCPTEEGLTVHAFPLLASTLGKIFQPFFDAMAWVLAAFYSVIPNYAIDIALLTIVVMAVTAPLTIKSTRSMAAMTQLQPKMKELQKKYKNDKVKLNEEMMAMYRENGVSPLGGCIPMLIQFPFFIVLYEVINGLTNTVKGPHNVLTPAPRYIGHTTGMYKDLFKHPGVMKSFGLNLADTVFSHNPLVDRVPFILLILIAIGLQYFQMHQMTKRNGGNQSNPQMQAMQKYMPLIFAFIYIRISAGVNVYFVVSSLGRIGLQMWAFRSMPEASTARVGRLGTAKPGRKTLMERLAEAQQRALEQQRTLQQGGTGETGSGGSRPGTRAALSGSKGDGSSGAQQARAPQEGAGGTGEPKGGPRTGAPRSKAPSGGPRTGGSGGSARPGSASRPRKPRPAGSAGGAPDSDPGTSPGGPTGGGTPRGERPRGSGTGSGVNGRDRGQASGSRPDDGSAPTKRTRKAP